MALDGRPDAPAAPADEVADACREAGLVRILGTTSGESLAAVGLLGRALGDAGVPFQARLASPSSEDIGATDADLTVAVGRRDRRIDHALDATPEADAIERAYAVAGDVGSADPILGLAGAVAADTEPPARIREDAEAAGIDRRPGVAVPTADLADGLAHSTLVHTPFSGDRNRAGDALADLDLPEDPDADDRRRVASLVALAVAEVEDCPPRATRAIERALNPHVGGPYETVGGYADVLDALARTRPGLGIAVALGRGGRDDALEAWREHGVAVHRAVSEADRARHDGLVVAHVDAAGSVSRLESVARLVRDFRSPEPTVLTLGANAVVLTTVADAVDAAALLADAVADADVEGGVVGDQELATAPTGDGHDAIVEAVRRELR